VLFFAQITRTPELPWRRAANQRQNDWLVIVGFAVASSGSVDVMWKLERISHL
jgi:hypothetical protein